MDNYVYNAFQTYFHTLENVGYVNSRTTKSLLVLDFLFNLIYHDYRGYIKKEDYRIIGEALNCLYGTNCLIPYPDYLKMGKLKLGEMTEVLARVKASEDELKLHDLRIKDNDALISDNIMRIDEQGVRLDDQSTTLTNHENRITTNEGNISQHGIDLSNHEGRIGTLEHTKAMQNNKTVINYIPDINID